MAEEAEEAPEEAVEAVVGEAEAAAVEVGEGGEEVGVEGDGEAVEPEEEEDDSYSVELTVTVAICIPLASDEMLEAGATEDDDAGAKKKATDQPRALQFYHVSYYLLPTDEEPVATDVVTYVQVGKVIGRVVPS